MMSNLPGAMPVRSAVPPEGGADGDVGPLIRRGTRIILLLLWVFGAGLAGVGAWVLLNHARTHTETTAVSLEQFARRTMTLAAFVIDEYEAFLDERGGVSGLASDPVAAGRLTSLVNWLPEGSAGGVALPDGTLALSTLPLPRPLLNVSDRKWFSAPAREGLQNYVGPAVMSRLNGRYFFTYSTAYRGGDGRLLAVLDLGIPSASITGLAPDKRDTRMALVQHGGDVVAAQPFTAGLVGKPFALPAYPEAAVTVNGTVFGDFAVISIRNLPEYNLYAVVALPMREVLMPLAWGLGIGVPLLLMLTNLLLILSNQLQQKSREVEQALADNRVLFQEVHHRVKNNLQVVSSLMRLQTDRLPRELRPMMEEAGARIRAIALVHEQIYRTASPSEINLDVFLQQLVQQLASSMANSTARISTDLAPLAIGLDRAVPVAILATEAITNAIKHGLGNGKGSITVTLRSDGARSVLEVLDSGTGPKEDVAGGLGTRIMTALALQIDGEWTLEPVDGGTRFSLSWPAGS